jgi:hypothetical protein
MHSSSASSTWTSTSVFLPATAGASPRAAWAPSRPSRGPCRPRPIHRRPSARPRIRVRRSRAAHSRPRRHRSRHSRDRQQRAHHTQRARNAVRGASTPCDAVVCDARRPASTLRQRRSPRGSHCWDRGDPGGAGHSAARQRKGEGPRSPTSATVRPYSRTFHTRPAAAPSRDTRR